MHGSSKIEVMLVSAALIAGGSTLAFNIRGISS